MTNTIFKLLLLPLVLSTYLYASVTDTHTLSTTIIEGVSGAQTQSRGVTIDSSGNIYMVGYTTGALNGESVSSADLFVIKYNSSGTEQWTTLVNLSGWDVASSSDSNDNGDSIVLDSSGNIYVVGSSNTGSGGTYDMFVTKINNSGTVQWTQKSGVSGNDNGMALEIDSNNNIYAVGWANDTGGLVIKYDTDGNHQWTKTGVGGSGNNDRVRAIDIDSNDNIYIAGSQNANTRNSYIKKLSSTDGSELDSVTISGSYQAFSLILDSSNNVYAGFNNTGLAYQAAKILKYDSGLDTLAWTATSSSPSGVSYYPESLKIDSNGDIIAAIHSYTGGGTAGDVTFAKFSASDGSEAWINTSPAGNHKDRVHSIHIDGNDNYFIVGDTYSSSLNSVNNPASNYSAFLLKYAPIDKTTTWTQPYETTGLTATGFEYDLKFDRNGIPYVLHGGNSNTLKLYKYDTNSSSWSQVGATISSTYWDDPFLEFDTSGSSNIPYVVYRSGDLGTGANSIVKLAKLGVDVDSATTSDAWTSYQVSDNGTVNYGTANPRLKIHTDGTMYISYTYGNSVGIVVRKFTGSFSDNNATTNNGWEVIGATSGNIMASGTTSDLSLSPSGIPYVSFRDSSNSWKVSVKKYENGSWSYVGNAGFSSSTMFETRISRVDENGDFYVSHDSQDDRLYVYKYTASSNTWAQIGGNVATGTSTGTNNDKVYYIVDIEISPSGLVYVAYQDKYVTKKINVRVYDSENDEWDAAGNLNFSTNQAIYPRLTFDASGNIYTIYDNSTSAGAPQIMYLEAPNAAPTITGDTASQAVDDNSTITPFSTITLADAEDDNISVTILIDTAAKGALSGSGLTDNGDGNYSIASSTASSVQTTLRALTFTPTANRVAPDSNETTTFTLTASDASGSSTPNTGTTVISKSINDAPTDISFANPDYLNLIVGDLNVTDVDTNDSYTYSLVSGSGDTDNSKFYISGSKLLAKDSSYLTKNDTFSVRVQISNGSSIFAKALTVTGNNTMATITNSGTETTVKDENATTVTFTGGNILASSVTTALSSKDVIIRNSENNNTNSDITVDANISWSSDKSLTFIADRDLKVQGTIDLSGGTSSKLIIDTNKNVGNDDSPHNETNATATRSALETIGRFKIELQSDSGFKGKVEFGNRSGTALLSIDGEDYNVVKSITELDAISGADMKANTQRLAIGTNLDYINEVARTYSGLTDGMYDAFIGKFDGLGHTISNYKASSNRYTSFVGNTSTGASNQSVVVRNIGFESAEVNGTGTNPTAIIVGNAINLLLHNSYAKGTINSTSTSGAIVGIVDISNSSYEGSLISDVFSDVTINGTNSMSNVGGLVGKASGDSASHRLIISNTHAVGDIKMTDGTALSNVGGLIGNTASYVTVLDSYALGDITSVAASNVGGLIGETGSTEIYDTVYATGDIYGSSNVGGLIGYAYGSSLTVTNAYSSGSVYGNKDISTTAYNTAIVGGFIGYMNSGTTATLENIFSYGAVRIGSASTGGMFGYIAQDTNVTNGYYNSEDTNRSNGTYSSTTLSGVTGITKAQFANLTDGNLTTPFVHSSLKHPVFDLDISTYNKRVTTIPNSAGITDVNITTGTGGTPTILDGVYIFDDDAVIGTTTLANALSNGDVIIKSYGNGDINIMSGFGYTVNKLTLMAAHDVDVRALVDLSSGSGTLDVITDTNKADNFADGYHHSNKNSTHTQSLASRKNEGKFRVSLATDDSGFMGKVEFGSRTGTGLITIDGEEFTVINSATDIDNIRKVDEESGKYALGTNLDYTSVVVDLDETYSSGNYHSFKGKLEGLGHTISNMKIDANDATHTFKVHATLFPKIYDATIRNFGLVNVDINGSSSTSYAAPLATYSYGNTKVHNVYTTGKITAKSAAGLVSTIMTGVTSASSEAQVTVSPEWDNIFTSIDVTSTNNMAGGLFVSMQSGRATFYDIHTTGDITAQTVVGGIGAYVTNKWTDLRVSRTYATGDVTSNTTSAGGLFGDVRSTVVVNNNIGVKFSIQESFFAGNVKSLGTSVGSSYSGVGGIIGVLIPFVDDDNEASKYPVDFDSVYTAGSIYSAGTAAGGLVGALSVGGDGGTTYLKSPINIGKAFTVSTISGKTRATENATGDSGGIIGMMNGTPANQSDASFDKVFWLDQKFSETDTETTKPVIIGSGSTTIPAKYTSITADSNNVKSLTETQFRGGSDVSDLGDFFEYQPNSAFPTFKTFAKETQEGFAIQPSLTTVSISPQTASTATISATVNSSTVDTNVSFEFDTNSTFNNPTSINYGVISGSTTGDQNISKLLTGINSSDLLYYRTKAVYNGNTKYSNVIGPKSFAIIAQNVIKDYADNNTNTTPTLTSYEMAGIDGVYAFNLDSINAAIDSSTANDANTSVKIQDIVDAKNDSAKHTITIVDGTNGSCTNGVCSPDSNALLGATTIVNSLTNDGNTAITSGYDLDINGTIAFSANAKLTLNAKHDINLNSNINATGSSKLSINTNLYSSNDTDIHTPTTKSAIETALHTVGRFKVALKTDDSGFVGSITVDRSGAGILDIDGEDYTLITNATELKAVTLDDATVKYAIANDIDGATITAPISTGAPTKFKGELNGLGHIVSDTNISTTGNQYAGLFGYTEDANISNMGMINATVTSDNTNTTGYGLLIGHAKNGNFHNVFAKGTLTANSGSYVGGLVGAFGESTGNVLLQDAFADATVNGKTNVGGLFGMSQKALIVNAHAKDSANITTTTPTSGTLGGFIGDSDDVKILKSYTTVTVNKTNSQTGQINIGGFIGNSDGTTIYESFATGDVYGAGYVGGFIGNSNSGTTKVVDAYASGDVYQTDSSYSNPRAGGFIGSVGNSCTLDINNTHTYGKVSATGNMNGGYVGNLPTNDTVNNSYWNISTNTVDNGISSVGVLSGDTNRTNGQFVVQSNFGFDFTNTWDLDTANIVHPILKNLNTDVQKTYAIRAVVTINPPSIESNSSVSLNALVTTNTKDTNITFEYDTNSSFSSKSLANYGVVTSDSNITKTITGLENNTTYNYRVKYVYGGVTKYSEVDTFNIRTIAISDINVYAADTNNAAPTTLTYSAAGTTGATSSNLSVINSEIATKDATDIDTTAKIQAIIDSIVAAKTISDYATNGVTPPSESTYSNAGITDVNSSNLLEINSVIESKEGNETDTPTEIQTIVDEVVNINVIEDAADASDGSGLTTTNFSKAKVTDVNSSNLAEISNEIASKTSSQVDTTAEIQAIVDKVNAINVIEAYATNNGTSTKPKNDTFAKANVLRVTNGNIGKVNTKIAAKDATDVNTTAKIQVIVDEVVAINVFEDYATSSSNTAPTLSTYDDVNVSTSDVNSSNISEVNKVIASKDVNDVNSSANIQIAVDGYKAAKSVIEAYADGNLTAPTTANYDNYAIRGVTSGNLAAVNTEIANEVSGNVDTIVKVQAIVDALNNANKAPVTNYATGASTTPPTATNFANTGISGVSNDNIDEVNTALSGKSSSEVDTVEKIQKIVDEVKGINEIEGFADDSNATKPTASTYAKSGVTGVSSENVDEVNNILESKTSPDVDTKAEIQAVVDGYNNAKSAVSDYATSSSNSAPTTTIYDNLGISGVNSDNLSAVNSAINAKAPSEVDTIEEIQDVIDGQNSANVGTIAEFAQSEGSAPATSTYTGAGLEDVNASNIDEINAAIKALNGSDANSTKDIQKIIDEVNNVNTIEGFADTNGLNSALTPTTYAKAGVTGVSGTTAPDINKIIGTKASSDVNSSAKVQAIVDNFNNAKSTIGSFADNNTTAPTTTQYSNFGVTGITSGNLAPVNEIIAAKAANEVNTISEIQTIVDELVDNSVDVLEDFATSSSNSTPTVNTYGGAGVTDVNSSNVDEINNVIASKASGDVNSTAKIQDIVDEVVNVNVIEAAATGSDGSVLTATNYTKANVTGVTAGNLSEINGVIASKNATDVNSSTKVQAVVDEVVSINVIEGYATKDTNKAPTTTTFTKAGVTGVSSDNLFDINLLLADKSATQVDTKIEIQALVNGLTGSKSIIKDYADDNTSQTPVVSDFTSLGFNDVNSSNIDFINKLVDKTTATISDTDDIKKLVDVATLSINDLTKPEDFGQVSIDLNKNASVNVVYSTDINDSSVASVSIVDGKLRVSQIHNAFGIANITVNMSIDDENLSTSFNFTVTAVNDAPIFGENTLKLFKSYDLNTTNTFTVDINATDPESDTITYSTTSSNTANVTASIDSSSGVLTVTPQSGASGFTVIVVKAEDSNGAFTNRRMILYTKTKQNVFAEDSSNSSIKKLVTNKKDKSDSANATNIDDQTSEVIAPTGMPVAATVNDDNSTTINFGSVNVDLNISKDGALYAENKDNSINVKQAGVDTNITDAGDVRVDSPEIVAPNGKKTEYAIDMKNNGFETKTTYTTDKDNNKATTITSKLQGTDVEVDNSNKVKYTAKATNSKSQDVNITTNINYDGSIAAALKIPGKDESFISIKDAENNVTIDDSGDLIIENKALNFNVVVDSDTGKINATKHDGTKIIKDVGAKLIVDGASIKTVEVNTTQRLIQVDISDITDENSTDTTTKTIVDAAVAGGNIAQATKSDGTVETAVTSTSGSIFKTENILDGKVKNSVTVGSKEIDAHINVEGAQVEINDDNITTTFIDTTNNATLKSTIDKDGKPMHTVTISGKTTKNIIEMNKDKIAKASTIIDKDDSNNSKVVTVVEAENNESKTVNYRVEALYNGTFTHQLTIDGKTTYADSDVAGAITTIKEEGSVETSSDLGNGVTATVIANADGSAKHVVSDGNFTTWAESTIPGSTTKTRDENATTTSSDNREVDCAVEGTVEYIKATAVTGEEGQSITKFEVYDCTDDSFIRDIPTFSESTHVINNKSEYDAGNKIQMYKDDGSGLLYIKTTAPATKGKRIQF